jgi:diguanylate cyclase (GGDEF)-like protein
MKRAWHAVLAGLLLVAAAAWVPARAEPTSAPLDALVRLGDERPDEALAALAAQPADTAAQIHARLLARGLVLARNGREPAARAAADELRRLAAPATNADAQAGAELVLATLSDLQGWPERAETHARNALQALDAACPPTAGPAPEPASGCGNPRLRWEALQIRLRGAASRGAPDEALRWARVSEALARDLGDPLRAASTASTLAVLAAREGDISAARSHLAEARQHLQGSGKSVGSLTAATRLAGTESRILTAEGDRAQARRVIEAGLIQARLAGLQRAEAALLVHLSDHDWHAGRPKAALDAALRALPVARERGDASAERTLLHNIGLARIGLGQVEQGKRDITDSLALWERAGAHADTSTALREFATALSAQGEVQAALDLVHRERRLHADAMQHNRDAALAQLQVRFQREAQESEMQLRARDNELQAAQLATREWLQIVGVLVFVVAALTLALIVVLLRRMRRTQAELQRRQATLKDHAERDALTGLSNRRHFQQCLRERMPAGDYRGALLLVDIDHFKQINDRHGHTAGDAVLVEVARRIREAAGDEALVARWGGEEFLVHLPTRDGAAIDALAQRLLEAVGTVAVPASDGGSIAVTASIGHGCFPLPPHGLSLDWERALNLVDMALYSAKGHGRNQALGVMGVQAADADALRSIERDFERACQEGRVTLSRHGGPARPFIDERPTVPCPQPA